MPHPQVRTMSYGAGPSQVGDLRLPSCAGPVPVVVLLHGGFWYEPYKRDLMDPLADDLTARGYATWNLEYRRVGESGGGWPRTAEDVAAGIDRLEELAKSERLDLSRVVLVGHSAGGHLALWAAARHRLPSGAPGALPRVRAAAVVSLAGVTDLAEADRVSLGGGAVADFLGREIDRSSLYPVASPIELVPLGIPELLAHGASDGTVPVSQSQRYAVAARAAGDSPELLLLRDAGHFDLIDPATGAWKDVAAWLARTVPGCR